MSADRMKVRPHTEAADDVVQAYLALGDALRLATLPTWVTAELTISQLKALFLLAHHGQLAVGELAELLGVGNSTTSILVQQLVEQGLVARAEDPEDRRRTLVRPTTRGARWMSGPREQKEVRLRHWLGELDDEDVAALRRGLRALVEVVDRT